MELLGHHLNLAIRTVFVENILLAYFLGMCSYLVISKKVGTALGLGAAVTFVMTLTTPVNWLLYHYLLRPNAMAWTGVPALAGLDLSFLGLICFIATIAALVQVVEMFIEKTSDRLYQALGIFLPLITVNCAVLGAALFMVQREYNFLESVNYGFSAGLGWFLAIVVMASTRYKLQTADIPKPLRGLGITMLTTGLIAMAFMGFTGIRFERKSAAASPAAAVPATPPAAAAAPAAPLAIERVASPPAPPPATP